LQDAKWRKENQEIFAPLGALCVFAVKILTIGRHNLRDIWLKLQRGSNFNVISFPIIAPAIS
jgi:hypothetical protein